MIPAIYLRSLSSGYDGPKREDILRRLISVTALGGPPRIAVLSARFASELPEPAPEDRLAAWIGTAAHAFLAQSAQPGEIVEERLKVMVGAWIVSGQADLYEPGLRRITDWKFPLALSLKFGAKPEWDWQLDALTFIWRENGRPVETVQDIVTGIDWRKSKLATSPGYPESPWGVYARPARPQDEIKAEIVSRLDALSRALDVLPECSPEERWERRDRKTGRVESGRCREYCPCASVCDQYKKTLYSRA